MWEPHHLESEAAAVVAEAHALERETRIETAELVRDDRQDRRDPRCDPKAEARRMEEAAAALVEISYRLQDPLHSNPYAPLAAKVIGPAQQLLEEIRSYTPAVQVDAPPASGT